MSKSTVLIFGGGVGGLSAAQELTEGPRANHFDVTIVNPGSASYGGKARSDSVDGMPPAARKFPGEHGFRFFPTFYRHVTDTMTRIPSGTGGLGRVSVADHLVDARRRMLARHGAAPLELPGAPDLAHPGTLLAFLQAIGGNGIPLREYAFFATRLLELATTPKQQRLATHERVSWWEFIHDGQPHSAAYDHYLGGGLTRTLVAAKPTEINAKTGGDVLLRMLVDSGLKLGLGSGMAPGLRAATDRILDGPTTEVWIRPWLAELERRGVRFEQGTLDALHFDGVNARVGGATVVNANGQAVQKSADFYVCALPVEKMADVLQKSPEVEAAGENLKEIRTRFKGDVRDMVGMQFYLSRPLDRYPRDVGHVIYVDSAWALTGICQSNFWRHPHDDLAQVGAGNVQTVWSTILSDWESLHPGPGGSAASTCTRAELRDLTIAQLELGLNGDGITRFDKASVLSHYLDASLTPAAPGGTSTNTQPLLVNKPDRWRFRPEAAPAGLPNLLLAADYVRTNSDLATMEAANEAARRAVNAILERVQAGPPCEVFELYFPEVLGELALDLAQGIAMARADLSALISP